MNGLGGLVSGQPVLDAPRAICIGVVHQQRRYCNAVAALLVTWWQQAATVTLSGGWQPHG